MKDKGQRREIYPLIDIINFPIYDNWNGKWVMKDVTNYSQSIHPPSFSPWFKLPSLILCFSHSTSSLTTPPALTLSPHPPSHSLLQCVTTGARCLVRENVPTYQKAPGFWVEAAKRRKRSSWIQWVRMEGWGQSCEERWLIPAAERRLCWKGTKRRN